MGFLTRRTNLVSLSPAQKPSEPPRPQSMLFVVDRSMDPVAPFLHEFTYQAMVNDLLEVEDGKTYKSVCFSLVVVFA